MDVYALTIAALSLIAFAALVGLFVLYWVSRVQRRRRSRHHDSKQNPSSYKQLRMLKHSSSGATPSSRPIPSLLNTKKSLDGFSDVEIHDSGVRQYLFDENSRDDYWYTYGLQQEQFNQTYEQYNHFQKEFDEGYLDDLADYLSSIR